MVMQGRAPRTFVIFVIVFLFADGLLTALSAEIDTPHVEALSGELHDGIRTIDIVAYKYGYFPNPVVVGRGERVRLLITAMDVMHGIRIPEFAVSRILPKGRTQVIEFTPDRVGQFMIHCNVYCGPEHGKQKTRLIVR